MIRSSRYLIIPVFILSGLIANDISAQTITGTVFDNSSEPLPGVQIVVENTRYGTVTARDGSFLFEDLAPGSYVLSFRFIGFKTATHNVDLTSGSVTLNITLVDEAIEIDEVTVTADGQRQVQLTRSSLSVSTLDAADLTDVRGQSLGETLEHVPGITSLTTGPSINKPVIRGLHSDRLVVMNSGIRQEGQQWGGEHAPEIDPFVPDRIEVIRGASGVEYGVGAIGGVIRVEPRELPETPGYGGQVTLNGFSNSKQVAGSIHVEGAPTQVVGLGWRVQGSLRRAGDASTPRYVLGNTAYREVNGSAAVGYHVGDVGFEVFASRFSTELGIYKGSHINTIGGLQAAIEQEVPSVTYDFSYGIDNPKQTVSHDIVSGKVHWERDSGGIMDFQYGFQRNHREEYDAHGTGVVGSADIPAFDLTLLSQTADIKYRTAPRKRFFTVFGASGMTQGNENDRAGYLIPNFRAVTGGLFGRGVWSNNIVTAEAGSRLDHRWFEAFPRSRGDSGPFERVTRSYTSASFIGSLLWQFHRSWSIAGNAGSAWRPPNMSELFSYGLHHGTAQFEIGDSDLEEERSFNLDGTLRHASRRLNVEVSSYLNLMNGYIFALPLAEPTVTIRGVFPTFQFQQTDARFAGIDALIEYDVTRILSAGASGSIIRAVDRDDSSDLIGVPADRAHLHIGIDLPAAGSLIAHDFEIGSRLVARQTRYPDGVDYADPPPGYAIVEFDYTAQIETAGTHMDISLSVDNVFNTSYRDYLSRYRYFADDIGRTIVLRLRIPLGSYRS